MSDEYIKDLDARMDLFETLVPINQPFGIWIQNYTDWYAINKGLELTSPEAKSRLSRFIKAKILGGISLQGISLVDMGRVVFATFNQHKNFSSWLNNQQYNEDIQDNTQEIINNELANRKWYEDRTGIKFEASSVQSDVCSSKK